MYLVYALLAAALFAGSTVVKHRSAQDVAARPSAAGRGLGSMIVATLRHPQWLTGIALDTGALACQVLALHLGPLDVVQPLLTVSLVIALLAERTRLPRAALLWSLVLLAALAGVVAVSRPAATAVIGIDRAPAVVAVSVVAFVVVGCLLVARRRRRGAARTVTLALGAGITYAGSAALLKVLGNHVVQQGAAALLSSWQLYAVLICGAAGLLLNQLAFTTGSLRQALPTIAAVDPIAGVALGVLVYDEQFRGGPGGGTLAAALLGVVLLAVVQVTRSGRSGAAEGPGRAA